MTPEQTEAMAQATRKRLAQYINRTAAQQLRRWREQWSKQK